MAKTCRVNEAPPFLYLRISCLGGSLRATRGKRASWGKPGRALRARVAARISSPLSGSRGWEAGWAVAGSAPRSSARSSESAPVQSRFCSLKVIEVSSSGARSVRARRAGRQDARAPGRETRDTDKEKCSVVDEEGGFTARLAQGRQLDR